MQKEIFEINYKGYIAYSSCKGLPQNGKQNSCFKISGATHYILQVFNNLK